MCIPVAGLHIWFLLHGISRCFHFIARHLVWWLNGSLFLLTQLHRSGLCKLPWLCLKSLKWTNCLCFRAIRKWEPYGGRLASVGRTTYPKGRMYIPFSWNKWVQSKHLLSDFWHTDFWPQAPCVHPLPSHSYVQLVWDVGWSVSLTKLGLDYFSTSFLKHTGLSPPIPGTHLPSAGCLWEIFFSSCGERTQEWVLQQARMICRRARINGSHYSLIPPRIMIPEGFTTERSQAWWRAPCSSCWWCS